MAVKGRESPNISWILGSKAPLPTVSAMPLELLGNTSANFSLGWKKRVIGKTRSILLAYLGKKKKKKPSFQKDLHAQIAVQPPSKASLTSFWSYSPIKPTHIIRLARFCWRPTGQSVGWGPQMEYIFSSNPLMTPSVHPMHGFIRSLEILNDIQKYADAFLKDSFFLPSELF